jgi:putative lipoprotein
MHEVPEGAANANATASAQVSGTAMYRERMALPPDASFEATLEDVSRADAPAQVLGRTRMEPAGQPPFRFSISYDPVKLQAGHKYAIRARVTQAGQLMFTTAQHYALPPSGQNVELMLVRAQPTTPSTSTATLENTYWNLVRLGGEPVTVSAAQREPHLVLHSEDKRVAGFGGCNRMTGSYSLSGQKLSFSQMAGTMMACPDGMQYERAFYDALGKVAGWRIEGETLELFDAAGTSLAQFESRDMR